MTTGNQNHDAVVEKYLRKQLAVAVRSIQWSYAIFWSLSASKRGVLEWSDGYYNGDIKTRKTVQEMELKADKIGLKRSEQLRELYKSLLEEETEQPVKRSSPALSPEDLTDAEWYFLVCMSFVFNPGQSLPGRVLATDKKIWLCNAQFADSKEFSRSLLAKSASIQTVVCFPHLGGVIEMGTTELVSEDPNLLQHVKACLLNFSKPLCSVKYYSAPDEDDKDKMCYKVDNDQIVDTLTLENLFSPSENNIFDNGVANENHEKNKLDSPDEYSNGCEHNHKTEEDSFMFEATNDGTSNAQSWHFMDDDFSNDVQDSLNSSDCISEAIVNKEKGLSSSKKENITCIHLKELQNFNYSRLSSLGLAADDEFQYKRTLSAILSCSPQLVRNLCFPHYDSVSSFIKWDKGGHFDNFRPQQVHQKILKKILLGVPFMYGGLSLNPSKQNAGKFLVSKLRRDARHPLHDKQKENEKYLVLKSMVPSITEVENASILNNTISYLEELETRVQELESCMDSVTYETRTRKKNHDDVEQTSDNNYNDKNNMVSGRKPWINKRKAWDIDETEPDLNRFNCKDGMSSQVKVSLKELEVFVEIRCPYREYILLDIMDAMSNLHLDAHSIQSSTLDGVLTLTLKSKCFGAAIAPVGMIEQELWKVTDKC